MKKAILLCTCSFACPSMKDLDFKELAERIRLEFCTNGVFETGDTTVLVGQPYNCVVGCTACAKICPNDAIGFPTQDELKETLRRLREQNRAETAR